MEHRSEVGYHPDRATAARMEAEHGLLRAELERRAGGMPEPAVLRDAALARVELAKPGTSAPTAFRHVLGLAKEAVAKGYRFAKFAVETGRAFGRKVGQHLRSAWETAMDWWHSRQKLGNISTDFGNLDLSAEWGGNPRENNESSRKGKYRIRAFEELSPQEQIAALTKPYWRGQGLTLKKFSDHIRRLPFEVIGLFNDAGEMLGTARWGLRDKVMVHPSQAHLAEDATVVHNHPESGPISIADLQFAFEHNVKRIIVICKNGRIFEIWRPEGGWPVHELKELAQARPNARGATKKYFENKPAYKYERQVVWDSFYVRDLTETFKAISHRTGHTIKMEVYNARR